MRTQVWLPRIFAAIGVMLLFVCSVVYMGEQRFIAGAARATGIVVDLDYSRSNDGGGTYHPVIRFVTAAGDSIEFRSNTGTNPPSYERGESVEVLYDPAGPQSASTSGFFALHIGSFVTGLLGVIFAAIGGIWLFVRRRAAAIAEEVRRTGQRIECKVNEVERRMNIQVNRVHPWRIVAQWEDPGTKEVHIFRSANIWFDPSQYVKDTVTVFVDRNDRRRYLLDIDFLPKAHV